METEVMTILTEGVENIPSHNLNNRFFEEGKPKPELDEIVQRVVGVVNERLPRDEVLGVFVVGSQAYGTAHSGSDLDILILTKNLDYKHSDSEMIAINQAVNTSLTAKQVVDLINGTPENKHLKGEYVEVFIRSYGSGIAFDLVHPRWVKLNI